MSIARRRGAEDCNCRRVGLVETQRIMQCPTCLCVAGVIACQVAKAASTAAVGVVAMVSLTIVTLRTYCDDFASGHLLLPIAVPQNKSNRKVLYQSGGGGLVVRHREKWVPGLRLWRRLSEFDSILPPPKTDRILQLLIKQNIPRSSQRVERHGWGR